MAEARLARRLKLADDATVDPQERLLAALGLPVRVGAVDVDAVLGAMTHDKKARDGRVPLRAVAAGWGSSASCATSRPATSAPSCTSSPAEARA